MIYLDNSATTRQYRQVTEMMGKYMEEYFGNPSALYQLGVDSEKALKNSRKQIYKAMCKGETEGDIYFTSGGTEADNTAIFGVSRAFRRMGNRIVTSKAEHPAVIECCKRLEKEGFEVIYVGVDKKCRLDMEQLERAVNADTILVTLMHVNNETGTIMPVKDVKSIMKKKNAPGVFHCDAVQSFGKLSMPEDADMISVSGHKIHGPKGSGAIYVRKGLHLPAFMEGGGQEKGMRSGTENVPAIAGFGKAVEMSAADMVSDMDRITAMRNRLLKNLRDGLDDIMANSVEETGTDKDLCCGSILNISFCGTRGEVLLHTLEQDGIYVSTGSACSSNKKGQSHVLKAMGLKDKDIEGTLRFSLGRFNSMEEMDVTAEKVTAAVRRFRKLGSFR